MQKLSHSDLLQLQTSEQFTCQKVSELSGLPLDVVNNMYPSLSNKYHGNFDDSQIIQYYEDLLKQTDLKQKTQSELETILFEYPINDLLQITGQNDFIQKFEMLENAASQLEIVKHTIIRASEIDNNPKYNTVLKPLYEGLQLNLSNIAHISKYEQFGNMYQTIMDNLNRVVVDKQLHDKMVSDDNAFYFNILKNLMSGVSDSFYTNITNVEQLVSDKQALLMDLLVFINHNISQRSYDLKFVSTKTYNEYLAVANDLTTSILSSMYDARTLRVDDKRTNENQTTVRQLTDFIDENVYVQLGVDLWNVPQKAIMDCIHMIFSMKHLFAIPIRKNITLFVTKSRQLMKDVNNARIARNMAGY